MALLQLLHKPCFKVAVTGATAHFLQRALRSSLVLFLRVISSGVKSTSLFVLIFFRYHTCCMLSEWWRISNSIRSGRLATSGNMRRNPLP